MELHPELDRRGGNTYCKSSLASMTWKKLARLWQPLWTDYRLKRKDRNREEGHWERAKDGKETLVKL